VPQRQLQIAEDDGQEIVEIVRDAAGQLSERFHFLRLTQACFGRLPPFAFRMELTRRFHREHDQRYEESGRGNSEDQVSGHVPEPALHDVPGLEA
jgi:hypothetical protein